MDRSRWLETVARWLADRGGTGDRAAEIRHHLEDASAAGHPTTITEVGSLTALAARIQSRRALRGFLRTLLALGGLAAVGFGVFVAIYPFGSVALLSYQSLGELPEPAQVEISDDHRGVAALFDDDFTLATRTYRATSVDQVEADLFASGFVVFRGSRDGFGIECCGSYDGLDVQLEAVGDDTVATVTAIDSDIGLSWPFLLFISPVIVFIGLVPLSAAHAMSRPKSEPDPVSLTLS